MMLDEKPDKRQVHNEMNAFEQTIFREERI